MIQEINTNLEQIRNTCRLMGVKSLALVGSAARENDYSQTSDIDFLYSMILDSEGLPASQYDYFDLLWKLEELTGRKVDLIPEQGIRNKYFRQSLAADRVLIYEA